MLERSALIVACAVCALAAGCGDDSSGSDDQGSGGSGGATAGDGAGSGGSAGSSGDGSGGSGGSGEMRLNSGMPNLDCPDAVGPLTGDLAASGDCCHRASNIQREEYLDPDEAGTLQYRLVHQKAINHPATLGFTLVDMEASSGIDEERQSTLWSFTGPRADGEEISGMGTNTIGAGRYNCDGTYSYYSDTAAPAREISDDVSRWAATEVPTVIDTSKSGRARSTVPWADNKNRGFAYVPFFGADFSLTELVTQGFDIETIDTEGEGRDCIGTRDGMSWNPGGNFIVYARVEENDIDTIAAFPAMQTFCELFAFGIIGVRDDEHSCANTPRCEPLTEGCNWLKLPDSLCPDSPDEGWGCHVADENNPDGEPTNCTAEPPSGPLDPDQGATSEGQCCDPLGQSNELPECNAWLVRNEYVAAAAVITEEPANEPPTEACPAE